MVGRSAEDWSYLAERLATRGLQVVAPDLRGHGANAAQELTNEDYHAAVNDVADWMAWAGVMPNRTMRANCLPLSPCG